MNESNRIRIVHCIGSLRRGGAEKQLVELITRLPSETFEQHLVLIQDEGPLIDRVRESGCGVMALGYGQKYRSIDPRFFFSLAGALLRYIRFLRKTRPHILHAQLDWANILSVVAGRIAGVPQIITSRLSMCRDREARTFRQKLENFMNRRADAMFINSNAVGDEVTQYELIPREQQHMIYNGVIVEDFPQDATTAWREKLNINSTDILMVSVANLHPYKGHDDLIEAVRQVDHPHLHLAIAGRDAGMREQLEVQIEAAGLASRVHLLGEVADVPGLLLSADIFVHPSHEEGFSNAILEGMTAGLPCIVTEVGGNAEAVRKGEEGFVVPARDPSSLAEAIANLVDEVPLRKQLGSNARRRIESEFSMDRMIERFENWYRELAGWESRPSD